MSLSKIIVCSNTNCQHLPLQHCHSMHLAQWVIPLDGAPHLIYLAAMLCSQSCSIGYSCSIRQGWQSGWSQLPCACRRTFCTWRALKCRWICFSMAWGFVHAKQAITMKGSGTLVQLSCFMHFKTSFCVTQSSQAQVDMFLSLHSSSPPPPLHPWPMLGQQGLHSALL